jgi:pimeloyl-ACP methyl ester carboxylesterase
MRSLAIADEKLPPNGRLVTVNDMEMYYEVHGKNGGDPLILLHGFTASGLMWKPLIPHLGKHYKVILPDLRGHGRSTNPSGEFTHRQAALDIFALIDTLKIRQFRAIGASSGGMTLLHMATQQPERVEAMVLIGATHYFPKEVREIQARMNFDETSGWYLEFLRTAHKRGDAQIREIFEQFRNMKDSYDDVNFTPSFLSTIQARTLIMHGDRDEGFPVKIPVEMYQSIPNSYLWIAPNQGHGLALLWRKPEVCTETFLEFLRGDWEEGNSED